MKTIIYDVLAGSYKVNMFLQSLTSFTFFVNEMILTKIVFRDSFPVLEVGIVFPSGSSRTQAFVQTYRQNSIDGTSVNMASTAVWKSGSGMGL